MGRRRSLVFSICPVCGTCIVCVIKTVRRLTVDGLGYGDRWVCRVLMACFALEMALYALMTMAFLTMAYCIQISQGGFMTFVQKYRLCVRLSLCFVLCFVCLVFVFCRLCLLSMSLILGQSRNRYFVPFTLFTVYNAVIQRHLLETQDDTALGFRRRQHLADDAPAGLATAITVLLSTLRVTGQGLKGPQTIPVCRIVDR